MSKFKFIFVVAELERISIDYSAKTITVANIRRIPEKKKLDICKKILRSLQIGTEN